MMEGCSLASKQCVPCRGGVPPLDEAEANKLLNELGKDWQINSTGHLFKSYPFKNFLAPLELANKIAVVAEEQGHHPDITISWGKCIVEVWTHKIEGLTESDFILAAKIDEIAK